MGKHKNNKHPSKAQGLEYGLTCICCPLGCQLTGHLSPEDEQRLANHTCPPGWSYSAQEQRNRTRMVTARLPVKDGDTPILVRATKPVKREDLFKLLSALDGITVTVPIHEGETIVQDICGLEVDIVAAEEYY